MLEVLKDLSYILIMKPKLEIDYEAYPGGFICPLGRLTSRYINMSGPIGIAYERSINYQKSWHEHDEIDLTFPQGSSRLEFEEQNGKKYTVSSSEFMWMPAAIKHRQKPVSVLWDNFALFPKEPSIESTLQKLKIKTTQAAEKILSATHILPRSALLNELVVRLFEDRIIAKKRDEEGLMSKIIEECLRIIFKKEESSYSLQELDLPLIDLSLRYIEANLFNDISAVSIAKAARTSPATLYRQFAAELGIKPLEFQRKRRLDEALQLMISGKYSISDVATIVGFQDLAAFSKSFKKQFGVSPKQYLEKSK